MSVLVRRAPDPLDPGGVAPGHTEAVLAINARPGDGGAHARPVRALGRRWAALTAAIATDAELGEIGRMNASRR